MSTIRYPINRTDLKTVTLGQGIMQKTIDNLYLGQLPTRTIVALVSSKAYNGDITLNPFNFKNFNLNEVGLFFDSIAVPGHPIKMDFAKNKFSSAYHTLFAGTGIGFSNTGNDITMDDYKNGNTIFVFDLTVDGSSSASYWSLQKTGTLSIQLRFNAVLEENVTAIIYSEFDNLVEVDSNRNIYTDYPC